MSEPITYDELMDRISQVSSFLVGYGDVAEIAAERLRRLMDDIDARGLRPFPPPSNNPKGEG